MSFTNFIDDGNTTIVQAVNGIRFFEESWVCEKIHDRNKKRIYSKPYNKGSKSANTTKGSP